MKKIKVSIQEIVNDFGDTCHIQGVIIGLKKENILRNDTLKSSMEHTKKLLSKYKPNYKEYIPEDFDTYNDVFQDIFLRALLKQQLSEILYSLV